MNEIYIGPLDLTPLVKNVELERSIEQPQFMMFGQTPPDRTLINSIITARLVFGVMTRTELEEFMERLNLFSIHLQYPVFIHWGGYILTTPKGQDWGFDNHSIWVNTFSNHYIVKFWIRWREDGTRNRRILHRGI